MKKVINTKITYTHFKNIEEVVNFAKKNNINDHDEFWFVVETEPEIIFKSIFEYYYEG